MNNETHAERAKHLPASTQFALVEVLKNIPYGANWGLLGVEEVKANLSVLKNDSNISIIPIAGGSVILVNPKYIESAVKMVDPTLITSEDMSNMIKKSQEALAAFDKFIASGVKKPSFETLVGVFCTNLVTSIRHNGTDYPAFRVNLAPALNVLGKYGCQVFLRTGGWVSIAEAHADLPAVFNSLLMSPTFTGAFLKIRRA